MQRWWLGVAVAAALGTGAAEARATTFDFEDGFGASTPFALSQPGVTATFAGSGDPDAFAVSYNFAGDYATMSGAFLTVGTGFAAAGSTLTITFNTVIHALSLLFALDDPANGSVLNASTDTGGGSTAPGTVATGYRLPEGVLTLAGDFTSVTLSSTALDFSIDTLIVDAGATDVPEPASLALLLATLPALPWLRRRTTTLLGDKA